MSKINVGQRVKWYSYYDDADVVRGAGYGLVISKESYTYASDYQDNEAVEFCVYEVLEDTGNISRFDYTRLEEVEVCDD